MCVCVRIGLFVFMCWDREGGRECAQRGRRGNDAITQRGCREVSGRENRGEMENSSGVCVCVCVGKYSDNVHTRGRIRE